MNLSTQNTVTHYELKLTGTGFIDDLNIVDQAYRCRLTALHGAKEAPQELSIDCTLPDKTGRYFDALRKHFIDGNQPITFTLDDLALVKSADTPVLQGRLTEASRIEPENLQYCRSTPYLDLHLKGCGYANRLRTVTPKRAKPFWAVTASAFFGSQEQIQFTKIDCRVTGGEAKDRIAQIYRLIADDGDGRVLFGFRIGDLYLDHFEGKEGTVSVLKGRLLKIDWAKVGGERVIFQRNRKQEAPGHADRQGR